MTHENLDTTEHRPQDPHAELGCKAEWHHPKLILTHTPGDELFLGLVYPEIALFERTFDLEAAKSEHATYCKALRAVGSRPEVRTVAEVLLAGLPALDAGDDAPDARRRLEGLASSQTELNLEKVTNQDHRRQAREYFAGVVRSASPRVLLSMALQRPEIHLRDRPADLDPSLMLRATATFDFAALPVMLDHYRVRPLMNMYFARDHMITTAKGVVLGRMANPQRAEEIAIITAVLESLKIKPLLAIPQPDTLEGGDFIPADDHVFIGTGLRTTPGAVERMLAADVFGVDRVFEVVDPWRDQQEMHLDTYFNVIDRDLVVLCKSRHDARPGGEKYTTVHEWARQPGGNYRRVRQNIPLVTLLSELKYTIVSVDHEVQELYGINFLTVGPRKLVGVAAPPRTDPRYAKYVAFQQALADRGVQATWVDMTNLKHGYGAAHCMTQVLRRTPRM